MTTDFTSRFQLQHDRGDGSASKLHVTIKVENLDGSGQGMDADFVCLAGDLDLITREQEEEITVTAGPRAGETIAVAPRELDLALSFRGIETAHGLTVRAARKTRYGTVTRGPND